MAVAPAPAFTLLVFAARLEFDVLKLPLGFPSLMRGVFARVPSVGVRLPSRSSSGAYTR